MKEREVSRLLSWQDQIVTLAPNYASTVNGRAGPMRFGDVGVVDKGPGRAEEVVVVVEGVSHRYPRAALWLQEGGAEGALHMPILPGSAGCSMVLEGLDRALTRNPSPESLSHICACLAHVPLSFTPLEKAMVARIAGTLAARLMDQALPAPVFADLCTTLLALRRAAPTLRPLLLYPTTPTTISPYKSVCLLFLCCLIFFFIPFL